MKTTKSIFLLALSAAAVALFGAGCIKTINAAEPAAEPAAENRRPAIAEKPSKVLPPPAAEPAEKREPIAERPHRMLPVPDDKLAFTAPFTSHAVIQRDCPVPVWGVATPGARVTVRIDQQHAVAATAGDDGKWSVELPAQRKPGAGHTLTATSGKSEVTLDDIAIGDVWLCSGQSNMDMNYGWVLTRGKEDIENANDALLRIFDDHNAVAAKPLAELTVPTQWDVCTFDKARGFSACGIFFGQALRKAMPDVPIGLIEASWSGSPIKTWLSAKSYSDADPACAAEVANLAESLAKYEAAGGELAYRKRLEVWKLDCEAKGNIDAQKEDFDITLWKTVELPTTFEKQFNDKDFDGCVWYRRTFTLTEEQASLRTFTLNLGAIDDKDITYVNGQQVGTTDVWNTPRKYTIPMGVLRAGENTIAIKTFDFGGGGGFTAKSGDELRLDIGGADPVPLAGKWRTAGFKYSPRPKDGGVSAWSPNACYNAMLCPLFPMAIKGAIWYQGCSDVGNHRIYEKVLPAMVADWRAGFRHPDGLPVYIVQLAAFRETHAEPIDSSWAAMRWLQMRLGETLEKSGTAVTIDIGHHTDIHPKDKKTVGERLASLALARTYGMDGVVEAGPIPLAASIADGKVRVTFKNASVLRHPGTRLEGFQLAGADGKFQWAEGQLVAGGAVALDIPNGMAPARVRYAWDDYPVCNLVGVGGVPVGPFEIDVAAR